MTFDVYEIAAMDMEQKLRNLCHQLKHQAGLGCNFGYYGRKVRYQSDLPASYSILKWGKGPSAKVQLCRNDIAISKAYRPFMQAAEMYAEFAELMAI